MVIQPGSNTPWGVAQSVSKISDEIISVETASHGGVYVTGEALQAIPQAWREYGSKWSKGWGDSWYEEDCAVVAVVLTHPHLFPNTNIADLREYSKSFLPAIE